MAYDRDFHEPYKFKWYNSERREEVGAITSERKREWNASYPTMVQTFLLDGTNTDAQNMKTVTLLTLANGIHMDLEYYAYWEEGSLLHPEERGAQIRGHVNTVSSDGTIVKVDGVVLFSSAQSSPSLDNIRVFYTPSVINYDANGDFFDGWVFGYLMTKKYWENPNQPAVNTTQDALMFNSNWDRAGLYHVYTQDDWNLSLDWINEHGDGTPITPILPSEDTSEPGGGDINNPDYNPYSDPIDFPGLPTGGSAIASGFIRVYNPTAGQLQSLASKLWGNDFINTIHKIMNDPMEAMISLHSVPFQIVGGGNANIEVGNFDTEVSAKTVTTQYYTLDCGNISIPEHWSSALDYSPYTNVDCFIPFVGVRPLQIDDVMGRILNLKYNIDVLTGCAVAMLKCGDSVLYTYNTQVHTEIPYTMSSYGRLIQSIIGVAGTAIGATAGGAGAVIGGAMGGALGTAMTKHSDISRGGSLGGAVGVMGDFTPYLIIHRPIQSLAGNFASKKGYPSNISATLGSVSGYTVVDKVHLTGIDCTDTEREEIHALLKDGVII